MNGTVRRRRSIRSAVVVALALTVLLICLACFAELLVGHVDAGHPTQAMDKLIPVLGFGIAALLGLHQLWRRDQGVDQEWSGLGAVLPETSPSLAPLQVIIVGNGAGAARVATDGTRVVVEVGGSGRVG